MADITTGAHKAKNIALVDAAGKFVATELEGAMLELFQFANNGKTDIATVVGSPATSGNTFAQLKTHIQNAKNTLATPLGIANTSTLAVLASTLVTRRDTIATAVNAKGVAATSADALATLATKIGQISTGKKWASGTTSSGLNGTFTLTGGGGTTSRRILTVSGLDFLPSIIIIQPTSSSTGLCYYHQAASDGYNSRTVTTLATSPGGSSPQVQNIKADVLPAYVNGQGFALPTHITSSANHSWIAYE